MLVLEAIGMLCDMCPKGMHSMYIMYSVCTPLFCTLYVYVGPYCVRIMVEVVRVHIYYVRGCSDIHSLIEASSLNNCTSTGTTGSGTSTGSGEDQPHIELLLQSCRSVCLDILPNMLRNMNIDQEYQQQYAAPATATLTEQSSPSNVHRVGHVHGSTNTNTTSHQELYMHYIDCLNRLKSGNVTDVTNVTIPSGNRDVDGNSNTDTVDSTIGVNLGIFFKDWDGF